jgi:hypothetical protein
MTTRLTASLLLLASATFAVDAPKLPAVPKDSLAKKKVLLFSDDFQASAGAQP